MICWRCHEPVQGPTCVGCGAIQPPQAAMGPFQALGLPRRWRTDKATVMSAWRAISRKVHPDRFAGRPAVERRMALQWTAQVNDAKRVLTDDRARALYLATGSPAPAEKGGPALDPDFLEEVFDLQMLVSDEPATALSRAEAMQQAAQDRVEALLAAHDEAADAGLPAPDLSAVATDLARLRYLDKTVAQARAAAEPAPPGAPQET